MQLKQFKQGYEDFEKNNFQKAVKETLKDCIQEVREEYPPTLKVKDIANITQLHEKSVYELLNDNKIPGAKKIMGWRVPRDTFLCWWYGDWYQEKMGGDN